MPPAILALPRQLTGRSPAKVRVRVPHLEECEAYTVRLVLDA